MKQTNKKKKITFTFILRGHSDVFSWLVLSNSRKVYIYIYIKIFNSLSYLTKKKQIITYKKLKNQKMFSIFAWKNE